MGYGDEIMATSYARMAFEEDPTRKVVIVGHDGKPRWSPVFENNPIITTSLKGTQKVVHGKRCRPYIDYVSSSLERRVFCDDGPRVPGDIYFSDQETPLVSGSYVLIEPNIKPNQSPNKDWGFDRYQAVVDVLPHVRFVQCDYGARLLDGVEVVRTKSFRDALRVLRRAHRYVGPEGGMHHAAAALGVPAVVIFGGFISPYIMGYEGHVNIAGSEDFCGMMIPCPHCNEAMGSIHPEYVAEAVAAFRPQCAALH